jgi:hypothetical protein
MSSRRFLSSFIVAFLTAAALLGQTLAQSSSPSSSSSSSKHVRKPAATAASPLDAGRLSNGIFRNRDLGFSCTIPAGWVLRTEEMNAGDENEPSDAGQVDPQKDPPAHAKAIEASAHKTDGRVLLAAFSRPPQAAGEDVNSSILIAAETVAAYPGLKDAVQYFGPLTEVAKGQGFAVVNEPYDFPLGAKTVVREDFQKNIGSRLMRQSTLVALERGYAVSFTFIAGTEEDVEDLINGLSFALTRSPAK